MTSTVNKPNGLAYWGEAKLRYWVESLMHRAGTYGQSYRLVDVDGAELLGFTAHDADLVHCFRLTQTA